MSERSPSPSEYRRARPALVIDGEATVISRQPFPGRSETPAQSAARPAARPFDRDGTENAPRAAFGRRPAGRRPSPPDLVFQSAARGANEPAARKAERRGLAVFTDGDLLRAATGERRVASFAAIAAILALPALLLSAPVGPAEATPGLDAPVVEALVIDQLVTSIVPRGTGAVLSVEGRIRNPTGRLSAVPPLHIALADGERRLRSTSYMPGVSSLPAGRSVRFHSAVAVAKDSRGTIEVGFLSLPDPAGKTHLE